MIFHKSSVFTEMRDFDEFPFRMPYGLLLFERKAKTGLMAWGSMATLPFIVQKARSEMKFCENHIELIEFHGYRAARGTLLN